MNLTTLDAWIEWKERCAAQLCSEEHHAQLRAFANARFRYYASSEDSGTPIDAAEGCQIFEGHMHTCSGKTGSRWKDWLFAKVEGSDDDPLRVLEAEASLCIRTATRVLLLRTGSIKPRKHGIRLVTKDQPADPENPDGATLEDAGLIVERLDAGSISQWRELSRSAVPDAGKIFDGMNRRQRVALAAWALGLSRADPQVTKAADCGKQMVYEAYNTVGAQVRSLAQDRLPDTVEGQEAYQELILLDLGRLCIAWAKSENGYAPLFTQSVKKTRI